MWRGPCVGGLIGGAIGYASALTPSLIPIALMFLLLLTALGTIVGYAIGTTIEWALLKIPPLRRWHRPRWLAIMLIVSRVAAGDASANLLAVSTTICVTSNGTLRLATQRPAAATRCCVWQC